MAVRSGAQITDSRRASAERSPQTEAAQQGPEGDSLIPFMSRVNHGALQNG